MPTFELNRLADFADRLLAAAGATDEEARTVGHSLANADAAGYASHGLMRVPFYIDMLKRGDIVSGVELQLMTDEGPRLTADAQWGFGRVQMGRLLQRAISRAKEHGVVVATLRHSSHIGRLGEYCELAADAGLVSLLAVNTHGAARRVAPPGGTAPRLGTNPMAIGVPAEEPVILDFSTSATAEGKVRVKKIAGETCPPGWLLDAEGQPTTDPAKLYAEPPGTILPMGGEQTYKGFGLALMIDILAGALSGGLCAREVPETPKGNCVFLMLVDPAQLGGSQHFAAEVRQLIQFVRDCPRVAGVERITLPGDPERAAQAHHAAQGLTFDAENWQQLRQLAEELNVEVPQER